MRIIEQMNKPRATAFLCLSVRIGEIRMNDGIERTNEISHGKEQECFEGSFILNGSFASGTRH